MTCISDTCPYKGVHVCVVVIDWHSSEKVTLTTKKFNVTAESVPKSGAVRFDPIAAA